MARSKLLFFWNKNLLQDNFSIDTYKNVFLPFVLRCSPISLLPGLYRISILDAKGDEPKLRDLKKQICHYCYMDNCAFTAQDSNSLVWGYEQLLHTLSFQGFIIQHSITNNEILRNHINQVENRETPDDTNYLAWSGIRKKKDSLSTKLINLSKDAETNRKILSSVLLYDLFNYSWLIMNRSRIFLHHLQIKHYIGWNENLPNECLCEWKKSLPSKSI